MSTAAPITHTATVSSPHPSHRSTTAAVTAGILAAVSSAAIFGFFYAWVCSTMWGLDGTDPRIAIGAMNAMNGSVRNAVFAPAFFGTPVVMAGAAWVVHRSGLRRATHLLAAGAVVSLLGAVLLTMAVNVPMNEQLAASAVPADIDAARVVWTEYSSTWQAWNITRTVASGIAFLCSALALVAIGRGATDAP